MAGVSIPTLLMLCGWTLLGLASAAGTAGAADVDVQARQATPLPTKTPLSPLPPMVPLSPLPSSASQGDMRQAVLQLQSLLLTLHGAFLRQQWSCSGQNPPGSPSTPPGNPSSPPGNPSTPSPPPGSGSGGATYTRWGRTSCPAGSDLVYKGWAGGSHYTHSGAAADYLCLPEQPQWANYTDTADQYSGLVYGGEYQTSNRLPNFHNHDHDVPCAVCRSPTRTSALMIPARTSCHPGFHREYQGYLMAGDYNHAAASQYVCVDQQPENVVGGEANHNGKLFYFVESRCGSLHCPPYVNGRELTCVVCSK